MLNFRLYARSFFEILHSAFRGTLTLTAVMLSDQRTASCSSVASANSSTETLNVHYITHGKWTGAPVRILGKYTAPPFPDGLLVELMNRRKKVAIRGMEHLSTQRPEPMSWGQDYKQFCEPMTATIGNTESVSLCRAIVVWTPPDSLNLLRLKLCMEELRQLETQFMFMHKHHLDKGIPTLSELRDVIALKHQECRAAKVRLVGQETAHATRIWNAFVADVDLPCERALAAFADFCPYPSTHKRKTLEPACATTPLQRTKKLKIDRQAWIPCQKNPRCKGGDTYTNKGRHRCFVQ